MNPIAITERTFGTKEWFEYLFSTQGLTDPSAYFTVNGYEKFRHRHLVKILNDCRLSLERDSMLDLGCGPGEFMNEVARTLDFRKATGVDFVEELIEHARQTYPSLNFEVANLPKVPFKAESQDLVLAIEVLYYLDEVSRNIALQEIHRVLRSGGYLLFSSRFGPEYFSAESARTYISRHFDICKVHFEHKWLYHKFVEPLYLAKRLQSFIRDGVEPGTIASRDRAQKLAWFGRQPFRALLNLLCAVGDPILRSALLPFIFDCMCRLVLPRGTQTNISIVARKP